MPAGTATHCAAMCLNCEPGTCFGSCSRGCELVPLEPLLPLRPLPNPEVAEVEASWSCRSVNASSVPCFVLTVRAPVLCADLQNMSVTLKGRERLVDPPPPSHLVDLQ